MGRGDVLQMLGKSVFSNSRQSQFEAEINRFFSGISLGAWIFLVIFAILLPLSAVMGAVQGEITM